MVYNSHGPRYPYSSSVITACNSGSLLMLRTTLLRLFTAARLSPGEYDLIFPTCTAGKISSLTRGNLNALSLSSLSGIVFGRIYIFGSRGLSFFSSKLRLADCYRK